MYIEIEYFQLDLKFFPCRTTKFEKQKKIDFAK